jgi:hypothetical protein
MSDPKDEPLEEKLARITARERDGELSPRDEEGESLRESWLAFGRLLEAASDDFDEAALVAKIRSAATAEAISSSRSAPRTRWIGLAAIAASLLIAAAVWRFANRDREQAPRDSVVQRTQDQPSGSSAAEPSAFDEQYSWDDSLDERIAEASEQLIYTAAEWRGYDAPYAAIDQRMQDLHEALGDEPL